MEAWLLTLSKGINQTCGKDIHVHKLISSVHVSGWDGCFISFPFCCLKSTLNSIQDFLGMIYHGWSPMSIHDFALFMTTDIERKQ